MDLTGRQYIGWKESGQGTASFAGVDPVSGDSLDPPFLEATEGEIDRAVQLAERAFGAYRSLPAGNRASFLRAAARAIEALGPTLVERASRETGLPLGRLEGERGRTTAQLRMFADVLDEGSWVDARIERADPDRMPAPRPDTRRILMAMGPVVVFGASNFPLAFSVAGGDTASALAAGCPVVVKGHPAHPGTSEMVGRAVLEAARSEGMPEGVFSLVHGPSPDVGLALVRHPLVKAVGFTGSLRAGRALYDAAAARPEPIPVYAEMGSTNPVFVLPRAAVERGEEIAERLHASFTQSVGQFCTKPGIVIGVGEGGARLGESIAARTRASEPAVMLHAGMAASFREGLTSLCAVPGVTAASPEREEDDTAAVVVPAVLTADVDTFLAYDELGHELFGPVTVAVGDVSPERALEVARRLEGHLTATVYGTEEDLDEYDELVRVLERKVGRLLFDGVPTGVEVNASMQHGGPYPATTDVRTTSVGTAAILRFARPICYQDAPQAVLPPTLRDGNPTGILRWVDGTWTRS